MSSVRLRRLQADYEKLRDYVKRHPRMRLIQFDGEPPERYQLEYRVRSLRDVDGELQYVTSHTVEIVLPRNYPRNPPLCRMLSPIFHPNIAPHAICIGDHWSAGEPLWSIVVRIGEMIAYQSYNTQSPLNGEAARWVQENEDSLPLDAVSLLLDEKRSADRKSKRGKSSRPRATEQPADSPLRAQQQSVPRTRITCPDCGTRYQIAAKTGAKRVRCRKCHAVIDIPSEPAGGDDNQTPRRNAP